MTGSRERRSSGRANPFRSFPGQRTRTDISAAPPTEPASRPRERPAGGPLLAQRRLPSEVRRRDGHGSGSPGDRSSTTVWTSTSFRVAFHCPSPPDEQVLTTAVLIFQHE